MQHIHMYTHTHIHIYTLIGKDFVTLWGSNWCVSKRDTIRGVMLMLSLQRNLTVLGLFICKYTCM